MQSYNPSDQNRSNKKNSPKTNFSKYLIKYLIICKTPKNVYQNVSINVENENKFYSGVVEKSFKKRYDNHKR